MERGQRCSRGAIRNRGTRRADGQLFQLRVSKVRFRAGCVSARSRQFFGRRAIRLVTANSQRDRAVTHPVPSPYCSAGCAFAIPRYNENRGHSALSSNYYWRRPCRVRSCAGLRAPGPSHGDDHDEFGPDRADVLQSGHWRHCQRAPGAGDRRARRTDGRGDRRRRYPVPLAEHQPRPRRLEPARAMRQEAIPTESARHAGGRAKPAHPASRGRWAATG
jgi:hypothetical protein